MSIVAPLVRGLKIIPGGNSLVVFEQTEWPLQTQGFVLEHKPLLGWLPYLLESFRRGGRWWRCGIIGHSFYPASVTYFSPWTSYHGGESLRVSSVSFPDRQSRDDMVGKGHVPRAPSYPSRTWERGGAGDVPHRELLPAYPAIPLRVEVCARGCPFSRLRSRRAVSSARLAVAYVGLSIPGVADLRRPVRAPLLALP
jgi:hypothetical protein